MHEIKGHNFHIPWTFLQCSSIKLHEANQPAPGKSVDCFSYLHNTFNENKPLSCQEEQFTGYCNKSGRSPFKKCRWSSLFINRWNGQQEFKTTPCKDIFPSVYVLSSPWDLPDVLEIFIPARTYTSSSLILLSTISSIGTYSLPSVGLWWWKRLNQEY